MFNIWRAHKRTAIIASQTRDYSLAIQIQKVVIYKKEKK